MSTIPSHYSEHYVNQRYNKALRIVQNLPASSSFQPNKDEKLQLYSLYKQVSHGDIDTQRPGIFDVVGRAKWDAWKKLQGQNTLEAKHQYVETLLKMCAEAYRKPAAKAQVQQIIQTFATLRPSDNDSEDSDDSEDCNIENGHDDEETSESVDEEEQAYLMDIQKSVPSMTPSKSKSTSTAGSLISDTYHSMRSPLIRPSTSTRTKQSNRRSWHGKPPRPLQRAPSIESTQSMMTAPSAPFRRPPSRSSSVTTNLNNTNTMGIRPNSTMSHRSDKSRQPQHLFPRTHLPHMAVNDQQISREPIPDEHFDNSVNPWVASQDGGNGGNPRRRYRLEEEDTSDDSIDEEYSQNNYYTRNPNHNITTNTIPSRVPSHSSRLSSSSVSSYYHQQQSHRQLHPHDSTLASPSIGGSVTSSFTATGQSSDLLHRQPTGNRLLTDQQYTSVVALGPATKRALETLQAEIIGLNERIDGLRQELVDRDREDVQKKNARPSKKSIYQQGDDDDEVWDAWGWVLKAALKHTAVNAIAAFVIVLFLFKRGNPIADAFIGSLYKQWLKIKLGFSNAKLVA